MCTRQDRVCVILSSAELQFGQNRECSQCQSQFQAISHALLIILLSLSFDLVPASNIRYKCNINTTGSGKETIRLFFFSSPKFKVQSLESKVLRSANPKGPFRVPAPHQAGPCCSINALRHVIGRVGANPSDAVDFPGSQDQGLGSRECMRVGGFFWVLGF